MIIINLKSNDKIELGTKEESNLGNFWRMKLSLKSIKSFSFNSFVESSYFKNTF